MCALSILTCDGIQIRSVEDWSTLAHPKGGSQHWKDGRSAKELAKAWFKTGRPEVPQELEALFKSCSSTKDLVIDVGIPEMKISLDNFRGETRNSDLILLGYVGNIRTLVGIEAKADEPFASVIQEHLRANLGTRSNIPNRINLLSRQIFDSPIDEELGQLRYQLLHGLAGTLIEAKNKKATQAVFVVHEFISSKVYQDKVDRNNADFEKFVHAFPGWKEASIRAGVLVGPIRVPGGKFVPGDIPILIGKATTNLV